MPSKKAPVDEFDIDKSLADPKYNRPPPSWSAPAKRGSEPATTTPAGESPGIYGSIVHGLEAAQSYDPLNKPEREGGYGVAQGLAGDVGDFSTGLKSAFPGIHALLKQVPGLTDAVHHARKFSEEPSESYWQSAGKIAGGQLPFMFLPGGAGRGGYSILGRWLDKFKPLPKTPIYQGGGKFAVDQAARRVPRQKMADQAKRLKASNWKKRMGVSAGSGAIGGAAGDPDDPVTGAAAGALGGAGGSLLGSLAASQAGQRFGRFAGPETAWWGVHHATGVPFWPYAGPMFVGRHALGLGTPIGQASAQAMKQGGRLIGQFPGVSGRTSGQAEQQGIEISQIPGGILELARQLMGIE